MQRWATAGLVLRPGASHAVLRDFEQRHAIRLPVEMRALYKAVDGMEENVMDGELVRFWQLSELKPPSNEIYRNASSDVAYAGYYLFADWSLWAHGYAVQLAREDSHGAVAIVAHATPRVLTNTFEEFLHLYIRNDPALFVP